MRVVLVAATILALSGSAWAQAVPKMDPDKTPSEIEAEKAYNRSLGNIPDKAPGDPWGTVRSPDAPKTTSAKAKNKASTAHN